MHLQIAKMEGGNLTASQVNLLFSFLMFNTQSFLTTHFAPTTEHSVLHYTINTYSLTLSLKW